MTSLADVTIEFIYPVMVRIGGFIPKLPKSFTILFDWTVGILLGSATFGGHSTLKYTSATAAEHHFDVPGEQPFRHLSWTGEQRGRRWLAHGGAFQVLIIPQVG
jgi:hypothetical protein